VARLPRLTVPGFPHHVIQRGNDRRAIFVDDADRERYLATLRDVAASVGLAIHAYVLMPNHVHLLVTPQAAGDVGRAMQALGRRYVRWFNDRHTRTGAMFEGRYRSTVVEADRYLLACMRYIELNPVRAALVAQPSDFRWSSHRHHIGRAVDPLINDHAIYWALGNTPFERQAAYRHLFEHGPSDDELASIRGSTNGGWLLGSAEGIDRLSPSRRAVAKKAGRPRRQKPDSVPN
jgi:putative transposase